MTDQEKHLRQSASLMRILGWLLGNKIAKNVHACTRGNRMVVRQLIRL